ncbi:AAA family ATPase [Aquihabitans sp. G128]|uniref:ATP-binding protein n=1 Tax=Aquihabitans sp. G128 TaxID=2849779 RepID=UPI001C21BEC9|nr:AAA family ATPase [Aquihabitans sp. G128]QXC61743.1 AAA family ATPase [Aquihabitans sp. G128]
MLGRAVVVGPDDRPVALTRTQTQVALALFVLDRHRPIPREELAHVLWGDDLSPHWSGAARGIIAKVRQAFVDAGFDRDAVATHAGQVQVQLPSGLVVDVETARVAVDGADRELRAGRAEAAVGLVSPALVELGRGFLPGVDLPWADDRRHELDGLARRGRRTLVEGLMAVGRPSEAIHPVRQLLEADPYDEANHRLLVEALLAAGDRRGAEEAYGACLRLLEEELGAGPSPETAALAARLASGTTAPVRAAAVPAGSSAVTWSAARPRTPLGTFVGRRDEAELLRQEVVRSGADGLRVVVVEGEAGVGKTRLAHEVADAVEAAGVRVLWGRCGPDTGLAYEPVVEALAAVLADEAAEGTDVATVHADLLRLLPELDARPGVAVAAPVDADRGRLFRAAATALAGATRAPVLWVIDDLQWASPDTLALLGHLGAELAEAPLTLLATARERPEAVAATLAHLARQSPLRVLPLGGLAVDDVDAWLAATPVVATQGLAAEVQERTGGNPLYVGHLLRAAVDAGGSLDPSVVPEELQAFLDQRIAAQPADAVLALSAVAVAGSVVGFDVLRAVTGLDDRALLAAVDRLVATRLLAEDATGDGLRTTHALVRDAVLAGLGPSRLAWLHLRVAEALEAEPERTGGAADLARHYAAAGRPGSARARRWAIRAGDEALARAAWETADEHAGRALAGADDPEDRIAGLVVRARAQRGLGHRDATDAALEEAISLARVHRRPRRFAEAVLALVGGAGRGVPETARYRWTSVIEEALAGLADGDGDDDLRVPLLGSLALSLLLTDRDDERAAAADEALARARADGDPSLVAQALLDHRRARIDPRHAEARLADLSEVRALAAAAGQPDLAIAAAVYEHEDRLLVGDRPGARASLAEAEALLERHPEPYWRWCTATWRVVDLLLDGHLDAAEEAAFAAIDPEADHDEAIACLGVNLCDLRLFQGRAGEVVDLLRAAVAANSDIPCYRAVLALCLVEAGDRDGAAVELDWFAADGFRTIPDDTNRLLAFAVLADVACQLGATEAALPLLEELAPHAGRQVVLNCFGGGGAVWGPVATQLAGLAELLGDGEAAATWSAQARCEAEAFDAPLVLARSSVSR